MNAPIDIASLVAYLHANPRVMCRHPLEGEEEREFAAFDGHKMWWMKEDGQTCFTHLVLPFPMTIDYTPIGFSITAFGKTTSFLYLPN